MYFDFLKLSPSLSPTYVIIGWVIIMMDLEKIVKDLCSYPQELEWFEFKESWYEPTIIGEYFSALSNPC